MWGKLSHSVIGDNEEREESFLDEESEGLCSLSATQRMYGFAACLLAGLICMFLIHSKILTIIAIICEVCPLVWYSLSYIPFARRMVSELMIRLRDTEL